ncbi:MAG: VOC family protein [Ignavibacteria bacterium]
MRYHHTGCLVENLESEKKYYSDFLGFSVGNDIYISEQKVTVCFVALEDNIFLELVQPAEDNLSLKKMIQKGITYYHIAFVSDNFETEFQKLINTDHLMVSRFRSEAFNNRWCAFFLTPDRKLIEVIEG